MNHLLVSREYPPAPYAHGGIGTYVQHIARLLAEHGETVHVIAQQWDGAPQRLETQHDGRLIVHRVPLARPIGPADEADTQTRILDGMAASPFPIQAFAWQAARLAESLIESAAIDVVEGQDYEAPLYYLLLRRALGLGPARQPPCIAHLHSPWAFVCRANGWPVASAYDVTMTRLEADAIRTADAVLAPSRGLAAEAAEYFQLAPQSIEQIPYPIGATPMLARDGDVWTRGTICYVGRMEPRKGVLEWIDAAVAMAAERPEPRFEFIGSDSTLTGQPGDPSVRAALERRVPRALAPRFTFSDALPREALWARLAQARLVVIPSRWENFPNAGIEAMCSGVPVLASPQAGITEIVEHERTGWIAGSATPDDLLAALRLALDASPERRAEMGRAASETVRRVCDNTSIVERHLAFRRRLVQNGAQRSLRVPAALAGTRPAAADDSGARGIAVVATGADRGAGLRLALGATPPPLGVAIVDGSWHLEPAFVEACETALARNDRVGVVSSWSIDEVGGERIIVRPGASLPHQWILDDVSPCCVLRASALRDLAWLHDAADDTLANGDLALALLASGWTAVTYPRVLSRRDRDESLGSGARAQTARTRRRAAIVERFPEQVRIDLSVVLALLDARDDVQSGADVRGSFTPGALFSQPMSVQLALVRRAFRNPRYTAAWIAWHGHRAWRAALRHVRRSSTSS